VLGVTPDRNNATGGQKNSRKPLILGSKKGVTGDAR